MRKTLIILSIIIVLAGIGVAGYFYFFNAAPKITVAPKPTLPVSQPAAPTPVTVVTPASETPSAPAARPRLVQISKGPVSLGQVVQSTPAVGSTSPESTVTYIERQSGNVYTYNTLTGASTRISNKTLPGIQSASWLPNASGAFVRYLSGADFSTINTYLLHANGTDGLFLPQNISDVAVSSTSVLMLASGVNGSVVSLARSDGTRAAELFTTPLSSLRVSFAGARQYLAVTRPSATLAGVAYLVDNAGHFSRLRGPLNGLVAKASPLGKWVLVSYTTGSTMQTELIDTASGEILPLPVATIADKCVWTADDSALYCGIPTSPPINATYPDDWYQGAVSFSDRIWKIQVAGRYAQLVLDFTAENKSPLDAQALAIDPLSMTLVFVNKVDESLWSYAL